MRPILLESMTRGRWSAAITPFPLVVSAFGLLALLAPLGAAEEPLRRVGALLATGGGLQVLHGVRRAESAALRRAVAGGVISILMGLLVLLAPSTAALALLLAIAFGLDGLGYLAAARRLAGRNRILARAAAGADFATALALLVVRQSADTWLIAAAAALRLFGIAWAMAVTPVHTVGDAAGTVIDDLGLGDRPEATDLLARITHEERVRTSNDRRWTVAFLITLFAIHSARLQPDGTLLGYAAPAVAVVGDMVLALLFAALVVAPLSVSRQTSLRWVERKVWRWYLSSASNGGIRRRAAGAWLGYRLRLAVQLRAARFSIPAALWQSLAAGMPVAAIVAATVPVWGMSWFFDTENWASAIWNSWAEARTDTWREAMVRAVPHNGSAAPFAVTAPGVEASDFSFVVIGDTGEGDASQQALRDQFLTVVAQEDVRFVVISSDVVYPDGAMIDYETKFWLQFKGVTKPVFAIPGNHDWFDALEAFLATFLQPDAARAAMRARAEADLRLTSTTSARIEGLIAEADRLRREYDVPTGFQRGPFFEFQSERFALVAIDTGIVKRIDRAQWAWLESALERAHGKLTMAILGHPYYAKSFDMAHGNEEFARLKSLLLDHSVTILMAGDTHDFEYYAEPPRGGKPAVHYFVNGGGGAYLSLGTSLDWPEHPPTAEWAFYPGRDAVEDKIERRTPWWKQPAWWWTKRYHAWPFSSEYVSALFDYNVAPFFQSFVEVRVEPSAGRVRLLPHSVHGRLRWRDLSRSGALTATSGADDDFAEWIVPMR